MHWSDHELESIRCDYCGSGDPVPLYTRPDSLEVVECPMCGLCYLNPRPKEQHIRKLYDEGYFHFAAERNSAAGCGAGDYLDDTRLVKMLAQKRKRAKEVTRHIKLSGTRCLEVGCATGEFTKVLKEMGAHPKGIDLAKDAVEIAAKRYPGIEFCRGGIEVLQENERYDVIMAFEVIEHVTSPNDFFHRVRDLLEPRGFFVVSTPNYECARRIGPQNWVGFNEILEHVYFFDLDMLRKYGERHGLEAVQWYSKGGNGMTRKGVAKSVRGTLGRLGIDGIARRARAAVTGFKEYSDAADRHGLHVIFEKGP